MATLSHTDLELGSGAQAQRNNHVTSDVEDGRLNELSKAAKHTRLVRILRLALPISCGGVVLLYGISAFDSFKLSDLAMAPLSIPKIIPANLTMDNPRYRGFHDDGGSYVVTAKTARPSPDNSDIILLNGIRGELTNAENSKTRLAAKRGVFDTKNNRLDLLGGIDIDSDSGMRAKLTSATYLTQTGLINSVQPVNVTMPSGKLFANKMKYWQKKKEAEFYSGVKTLLTSDKTKTSQPPAQKSNGQGLFANTGSPVLVTADSLNISDVSNVAIYKNNVIVKQDDTTMSTRELEVYFSGGQSGKDSGKMRSSLTSAQSRSVERIVSKYPVLIKRGSDQQVTGKTAEFSAAQNKAVVIGNVVISSGADRRATSQRAEFNTVADTALLTGNVVVRQNKNELRGSRLFVDRAKGKLDLTSPKGQNQGSGRIYARLEGNQGKSGQVASKSKKQTNRQRPGLATFKTTPGAPILIEADRLDVDNTPQTAVFRGNVIAKQGTFTIHTAVLTAHYAGKMTLDDAAAGSPNSPDGGLDLKKITADRNVIVQSADGQSATGDRGEFDLVGNSAVISGDVILKQGKNIVRGTRLKINLTTGAAIIDTSRNELMEGGWASRVQDKSGKNRTITRGNRPSMIFYPNQFKKGKNKKPSATKKEKTDREKPERGRSRSGSSSSWQIQTRPTP